MAEIKLIPGGQQDQTPVSAQSPLKNPWVFFQEYRQDTEPGGTITYSPVSFFSKTASTQTAAKRSGKRQMLLPLISALMAGLKASFRKMTWALWSQVMWQ